jgi:hypothetical protein
VFIQLLRSLTVSEENKPQIIIHKSNWAKQLIIAVVVLVFFFFAIGKNPSKSDFIQGCVKEYLKKEQAMGSSTSNYVSEVTTGIFGGWFEPLIERDDYVIFSKFNVEIDNEEFKMKIKAFGFWGNVFFTDGVMERKKPVQSEMERDESEYGSCGDFQENQSTQFVKTLDDFRTWAKSDEGFGEDNVDGVIGPDNYGVFTVTDFSGDRYKYIWNNGEWVYKN